jgi:hypothetical protein
LAHRHVRVPDQIFRLTEISGERVERDQEECRQHDGGISEAIRLFLFLQKVRDRGAEEKDLQAGQETRGDFDEREFVKQGHNEDGAADGRSHKTYQNRKDVPALHAHSLRLCCRAL